MSSKRFKKLPENTSNQSSEAIEKLLSVVKKNCTTKFDESLDLEQAVKIISGSARSMGIEVKE